METKVKINLFNKYIKNVKWKKKQQMVTKLEIKKIDYNVKEVEK